MYIKYRRNSNKFRAFGPYQALSLNESQCFEIAYFSYTKRYTSMKKNISHTIVAICLLGVISCKNSEKNTTTRTNHDPNIEFINQIEKKVIISLIPEVKYSYDSITKGVVQHLDRVYTYDYIPKELKNTILYQGIHRPVKGTSININLLEPAIIYFFFHNTVDGGYSEIFKNLKGWEQCYDTPKYDIHNGDHGLKMTMYKKYVEKGLYQIPPTIKDRACFNIALKFI